MGAVADPTDRKQLLREITPEDIEDTYRKGLSTAGERNDLMREKGRSVVADLLEEKGFLGAVVERTVKHVNDGWDNLKEAALRDPTGESPREALYFVGLAMWGEIQILASVFNAVGEVSGQKAENIALSFGASPGVARVINISVDIGTGFVPIGFAARSFARGVQGFSAAAKTRATLQAFRAQQKALRGAVAAIRRGAKKMADEAPELAERLLREADNLAAKGVAESLSDDAINRVIKVGDDLAAAQALPAATRQAALSAKGAAAQRTLEKVAAEQAEQVQKTAAAQTAELAEKERIASQALIDGLRVDGVPDAGRIMSEAAEAAGRDVPGPIVQLDPRLAGKIPTKLERAVSLGTKEERAGGFLFDLREQGAKIGEVLVKRDGNTLLIVRMQSEGKLGVGTTRKLLADILDQPGLRGITNVKGVRFARGRAIDLTVEEIIGGIRAGARVAKPSVKEKFIEDLTRFQTEMKKITETQARAETSRMAERLNLSLEDLQNIVPGTALDERQMLAYLKALQPQMDEMVRLARVVSDQAVDPNIATWIKEDATRELMEHAAEFFTLSPKFRGAEVTAGRAVEVLKEEPAMKRITNLLLGWDPDAMARGDFQGAMQTFAEDIAALADDPDALSTLSVVSQSMWQRIGTKWWPRFREAYMNMLLARPITQVRNTVGNTVAAGNAVLERQAGALFTLDKKTGLVSQESWFLMKGMAMGIGDGVSALGRAYKGLGPDEITRFDFVPRRIPGKIGRIVNLPGDTVRGMDNLAKVMLRRGSYYAQALREGMQKGIKAGPDLDDFVARRIQFPTEGMMNEANHFALVNTFQNDLGRIASVAQKSLQAGPLALWFPFMKTPINLAKYAWFRTPGLQLLSKSLFDDIAEGGVKADLAVGRLIISNMMGMWLFELAKEGIITGSGPVTPELRRAWLAVNTPYSVKTPFGPIPIANLEPGSTVFGLVADYAEVMNQLDEPTAEQGAMAITFAIGRDIADKTYWKTVSDLIDVAGAIKTGEQPGKRAFDVLVSPVTTTLTGGPLLSAVARAKDPILRETRTFVDGLRARAFGYSETLPCKRDAYASCILPPQAVGGGWVGIASPLTVGDDTKEWMKVEGGNLQVKIPLFPWNIGGRISDDFDIRRPFPEDRLPVELTPFERDQWQVIYGDLLRHPEFGMEAVLRKNPEYINATRALKREMFTGLMADHRSAAKDAFQIMNKDIGRKMFRVEMEAILPLIPEKERAAFETQAQESLNLLDRMTPEMQENLFRLGIIGPTPETGSPPGAERGVE